MVEWLAGVSMALLMAWVLMRRRHGRLRAEIEQLGQELAATGGGCFLVQPCPRCHELEMRLLEISPSARSLHYECLHCQKRMRAPAGSPEAAAAGPLQERLRACIAAYGQRYPERDPEIEVLFCTPASPLPFEQTTRQPIPEAVRTEVWRRDQGCCVGCGGRENLEFDHIIPVSRGGATSARNLQLLCKSCNLGKGASI